MLRKNFETKDNSTTTSGSEKKRARTIFGSDAKSIEKHDARQGKRSRAKAKFLLGR